MAHLIKEDFEIFKRHYSLYRSNRLFRPAALFTLPVVQDELPAGHLTAAEYEKFIGDIEAFLNDNDVNEFFKVTRMNRETYKEFYTTVRKYFPQIVTGTSSNNTRIYQTAQGLCSSFRGQYVTKTITKPSAPEMPVPAPLQIVEFYNAIAGIAYWLQSMQPPR